MALYIPHCHALRKGPRSRRACAVRGGRQAGVVVAGRVANSCIYTHDHCRHDTAPEGKLPRWRRVTPPNTRYGGKLTLVIVTPVQSLTEFDEPTPLQQALGQDGYAALLTKRQRLINNSNTFLVTARPELGSVVAAGYQPKLGVSARAIVTPGHEADFTRFIKDQTPVLMKANARGVYVSKIGLGGNPNEFLTMVLFDSFADISKFPAAYAKAAAEAKLQPMAMGTVINEEWLVYRYAADLSITR